MARNGRSFPSRPVIVVPRQFGSHTSTVSATDSAPATDVVTRTTVEARTVADSAPATDAVSKNVLRAVADSAPATDSVSRAAQLFLRSVADGGATTDSVSRALQSFVRSVAENIPTSDSAGWSRPVAPPLPPQPPIAQAPVQTLLLDTITAGGQFAEGQVWFDGIDLEVALTGLKGWWDAPAPVTARQPRRNARGQFRSASYRGGRSVQIEITATSDHQDLVRMRLYEQQVAAICQDPARLYPLTVTDPAGTYTAYVELDGAIVSQMRGGLPYSSVFSIPVAAPDPRKFSQQWVVSQTTQVTVGSGGVISTGGGVVSTGGGVVSGTAGSTPLAQVVGIGTAENQLVLAIAGGGSNMAVIDADGAGQVFYSGTLGPTDTVYINCDSMPAYDVPGLTGPIPAHGAVLNDGTNARAAVTVRGGWPSLMPGVVRRYLLSGALVAGTNLSVYARGAFA